MFKLLIHSKMREINEIEEWRPVKGFEGLYECSSIGRIKSLKNGIITQQKNNTGRLKVQLWKNGKKKPMYVHRIVAEAFLPNPQNLETVNHIDENPLNNRVDNLEWMSMRDNVRYSNTKKINQYTIEGKFIRTWDAMMDIVRELGYNKAIISKCCLHKPKNKSAYGFKWYFDDDPLQNEKSQFIRNSHFLEYINTIRKAILERINTF